MTTVDTLTRPGRGLWPDKFHNFWFRNAKPYSLLNSDLRATITDQAPESISMVNRAQLKDNQSMIRAAQNVTTVVDASIVLTALTAAETWLNQHLPNVSTPARIGLSYLNIFPSAIISGLAGAVVDKPTFELSRLFQAPFRRSTFNKNIADWMASENIK